MLKFGLIGILVIIVTGVFIYFRYFSDAFKPKNEVKIEQSVVTDSINSETPGSTSSAEFLLDQVNKSKTTASSVPKTNSTDQQKIAVLESTVYILQKRIEALEGKSTATTTTTSTSSNKFPIYIPLGAGGSTSTPYYVNMDNYEIQLDPADYPGVTSMQLEVSLKSNENSGPAYARLFNITDNSAVSNTEVSGTSNSFILLTSSSFSLASGKKTYKLQARNQSNIETQIQSARIRVNF